MKMNVYTVYQREMKKNQVYQVCIMKYMLLDGFVPVTLYMFTGGAMVIPGKTVKFDSISYSSTNDKWRIQALCRNPRIWLQTNMEYGSYIQINLHGYSGRTCNAYQPIFYNFDRKRTLLVSLARDHTSSNSSFTLGFICPCEFHFSCRN